MKDWSFFLVFAGVVDRSGLSFAEIARRTNTRTAGTELEVCLPVARVTIYRIYQGIDCPRDPLLLYRIARYGLGQTREQCMALEQLRQNERVTHTTSHHTAIKAPSTDPLPPLKTKV